MTQDLFGPTLTALLACASEAMTDNGVVPGKVFIAPAGPPAWDECCEDGAGGGQLWVRLVQVYPTAGAAGSPFPSQDTRPKCAPNMLAARIAVGVLRCAHTVDDDGNFPTADQLTADGLSTTLDASILFETLMCCLPTIQPVQTWVIDSWNPLGPDGGCRGGEWQAIVAVGRCECPEV